MALFQNKQRTWQELLMKRTKIHLPKKITLMSRFSWKELTNSNRRIPNLKVNLWKWRMLLSTHQQLLKKTTKKSLRITKKESTPSLKKLKDSNQIILIRMKSKNWKKLSSFQETIVKTMCLVFSSRLKSSLKDS